MRQAHIFNNMDWHWTSNQQHPGLNVEKLMILALKIDEFGEKGQKAYNLKVSVVYPKSGRTRNLTKFHF